VGLFKFTSSDPAHGKKIFKYIFFERHAKLYKKIKNENRVLEEAALLAILLLWEGMEYVDILKLDFRSFIIFKNTLTILIKTGESYRILPITKLGAVLIERCLRSLDFWTTPHKESGKPVLYEYGKAFKDAQNRVNSILREAAEVVCLNDKHIGVNKFREMGIIDKIITYDVPPATIASIWGPEISYTSLAPQCLFNNYVGEEKHKTIIKDNVQNSILHWILGVIEQFSADKNRYTHSKLIEELEKMKKETDNHEMIEFAKYLVNTKTSRNKYLDLKSVIRYLFTIKSILSHCKIKKQGQLIDESNVSDYLNIGNNANKEDHRKFERSKFKILRPPLNHYMDFYKKPRIKWISFEKNSQHSAKLVKMPVQSTVDDKIKACLADQDPVMQKTGLVAIMFRYLGLRKREGYNAEVERVKFLGLSFDGENEDYIEVFGKFSIWGRVPLHKMSEYLQDYYHFIDRLKETGQENIFEEAGKSMKEKLTYRINKIFGISEHTFRYMFATQELLSGTDPRDVGCHLRHSSERVLHTSYDNSAFDIMVKKYEQNNEIPKKISQNELMSIYRISRQAADKIIREIQHEKKSNVYTKGGNCNVFCNSEKLVEATMEKLKKKIERLNIKIREGLWK
jgi:integrase